MVTGADTTQSRGAEARRPHVPSWSPGAWFVVIFWAAVTVNGAIMTWLWLRDGGVTQIHNASDLWTSAGRVTGLLGAYLALLQVLLLARLPPLERQIGFDRLTVWHRRNGKLVIYLVVAHVVLITIGYAGGVHISVWKQFSDFLSTYSGMITATVGTAMMIAIVLSSIVIVRRRLPYEAWYGMHVTLYAAIFLAYLHQIPNGNEFLTSTSQSDWWIGLYVLTLALVIVYRVLRPLIGVFRHRLRVVEVRRETHDTVSLLIGGRRLERLHQEAGQFMLWRFLTPKLWWQSHPFSLSAAPNGRYLRITVKAVGGFTRELAQIRPGTRVVTEGPFGRFVAARRKQERVTLIAGGIGVTPLRAILEQLSGPPGTITFIHRVIAEADCVLRAELEALAAERGAALHHLIGDHRDPSAADLLSPQKLRELVPEISTSDVFLCGPARMMEHTRQSLEAAGVPRRQVHSERFALAA
jgi:predicted ferric reductase